MDSAPQPILCLTAVTLRSAKDALMTLSASVLVQSRLFAFLVRWVKMELSL